MSDLPPLEARADEFAAKISRLLDNTVTHGSAISALVVGSEVLVAPGASVVKPDILPLSLRPLSGQERWSTGVRVTYRLTLDDEARYMTVQKSTFGLWVQVSGKPRPAFRIDYVRDKRSYTNAYVHVHGVSLEMDTARAMREQLPTELSKYHFPVGGRRYRPCIEDFIEFLVDEGLAEARGDYRSFIDETREEFHRIQLKAAVRRDPETARAALEAEGS